MAKRFASYAIDGIFFDFRGPVRADGRMVWQPCYITCLLECPTYEGREHTHQLAFYEGGERDPFWTRPAETLVFEPQNDGRAMRVFHAAPINQGVTGENFESHPALTVSGPDVYRVDLLIDGVKVAEFDAHAF